MAGEKPSSGSYETFDSAGGPTIPDKGNYDHNDNGKGGTEVKDLAVPTMKQE